MKPKKKNKANLERIRFILFEIGIIFTLSLILLAFEWSTIPVNTDKDLVFHTLSPDQVELPVSTPRKPDKPLTDLKVKVIINPVPDEEILIDEPVFFDSEIWAGETFEIPDFMDSEPEEMEPVPFVLVEEKPLFNGKNPELEFRKYIAERLVYPLDAIENNVAGKVILSFVIDKNGRLTQLEVVGPVHPSLDSEALRVVGSSPLWTPGKQRTKAVPVRFYFPVGFELR